MLKTSNQTLFDIAAIGMNSAIINLCDCYGNVSSQTNIQFRVRYPGSYATDRMTAKGDLHKLGTVSYTLEEGLIIINAYVCKDFTDQRSIADGTLFGPTTFFACMYSIIDLLAEFSCTDAFLSINSFSKFNIDIPTLMQLLEFVSRNLPYFLTFTV